MSNVILTSEMGERLENEIFVRGWSLRDFARKSGVSISAISRYINGETKTVQASTMYKFAETLGTSVDWLRFGAKQHRKNDLISRSSLLGKVIMNFSRKPEAQSIYKHLIDIILDEPSAER